MPGVECPLPQGTIYAFADVSALARPSQGLAEEIMDATGVVLEAGTFYGEAGEGFLRVCFGSQSEATLTEAMDRLQSFFNAP
jgi:aspartate aminotransferase